MMSEFYVMSEKIPGVLDTEIVIRYLRVNQFMKF